MNRDYLNELIQENADVPDVLREILELARTGCIDHQGQIEDICGTAAGPPSRDECRLLVLAVHRLANIMAALRLEKLARQLNALERLGRDEDGLEFCREWWKIKEEIDTVLNEVCEALQSFSESSESTELKDGEST